MTREEARDEIKNLLDYIRGKKELKPIKTREDAEAEERKGVEALDMAIKALEREPKLQNRCFALTQGQMCLFCPYECEHKAESENKE